MLSYPRGPESFETMTDFVVLSDVGDDSFRIIYVGRTMI